MLSLEINGLGHLLISKVGRKARRSFGQVCRSFCEISGNMRRSFGKVVTVDEFVEGDQSVIASVSTACVTARAT